MDVGAFKKLKAYHVIFLTQNIMIGLGLLSLPHDINAVGNNLWIMPLLYALIAQVAIFPMIKLGRMYPNDTIFEINQKLLGKWLGKISSLFLITYAVLQVSAVSEGYLRLMQTISLPNFKIGMPLLVFLCTIMYIVLGGIKLIARFCIIAFFMTSWMIYYLLWPLYEGDAINLLPFFFFDLNRSDMVEATKAGIRSIMGFEVVQVYFPYIVKQEQVTKHVSYGIWMTAFFYIIVCLVSIMYFSSWQLENVLYPVLNLFKSVELTFIERIENMGLGLWVFLILSTAAGYLWMAKKGIGSLFTKSQVWHVYACAALVYFFIEGPIPLATRKKMYENELLYLWTAMLIWPLFLLMLHKVKNRQKVSPV